MNNEQVKMSIKNIRTDLENFRLNGQTYLLERIESNLRDLKDWRKSLILKGNETINERMLWLI